MADPRAIIDRIRSFGANVMSDRGKLVVINREKLPAGALDFIREHGREIAEFLVREADFEERAAIMEHDGGLTRPIAEYLTKMLMANPPEGADRSDWSWFVGQGAEIVYRSLPRKAA